MQEWRVRVSKHQVDPEGVLVRSLEIQTTQLGDFVVSPKALYPI